jgi:hypothetical protein
LQILEDVVVPIPDDRDFLFGEKARAARVRSLPLSSMLAAIEFNGNAKFWTVGVEGESADRMLPSKVKAI